VTHARSTIFVVDDEPSIESRLVAILTLKGFHAKCFRSPLQAPESTRSQPQEIFVSDVVMPSPGGVDLAILMTEEFPKCQVLLFSGMASTSDLLKNAHEKGYDFRMLSKPVAPQVILEEIGTLIAPFAA